jgi:Zn-dependent protease
MLTVRLLGFPVQIQLTFLLLGFFIVGTGLNAIGIVLWMATVFLSVLLHELAHAVAARWFGARVHSITIHAFGGVTMWSESTVPVRGWKRFVVAAAGSGVGLVLGLVLYQFVRMGLFGTVAERFIPSPIRFLLFNPIDLQSALVFVVGAFIWVSVLWGIVNWLPVSGLDGSTMLAELLRPFLGGRTAQVTRYIGIATAIALGIYLWSIGLRFGVFILAFLVISELNRPSA